MAVQGTAPTIGERIKLAPAKVGGEGKYFGGLNMISNLAPAPDLIRGNQGKAQTLLSQSVSQSVLTGNRNFFLFSPFLPFFPSPLLLFLTLTIITLFGCGGGGGGGGSSGGDSGRVETTNSIIGTSGGSITLKEVTAEIPESMFSQDVKVTLTEVSPTTFGIDNNLVLGTPVQITIEPIGASGKLSLLKREKFETTKQIIKFVWNNIDEAVASISASTCMVAKVASIGSERAIKELANIPCKLSNSTAIATEILFLYANEPLQKKSGLMCSFPPHR